MAKTYRVTGDYTRLVYSHHSTQEAAHRAAQALSNKWGETISASAPAVERRTDTGWEHVETCLANR